MLLTSLIMWSICLGLISGFLAGLLGIGGGLIIVPALTFLLAHSNYPAAYLYHAALATSLASIIITSSLSAWSHHQKQGIVWAYICQLSLPITLGAVIGGLFAQTIPNTYLKTLFILFALWTGWHLHSPRPPVAASYTHRASTPLIGGVIGWLSSWIGIGGGSLSVPLLLHKGLAMPQAVGTSALLGFFIALPASIGFVYSSWHTPHLPNYSLGVVYLPALLGISLGSIISTRWGAYWAHRLPQHTLKRIFAYLLWLIAIKMLWGIAL